MKKAILTIGLFTLVLASTSFAAPKNTITPIAAIDGAGSQDAGGNKKIDSNTQGTTSSSLNNYNDIDGSGSQDAGGNRKMD